jgi:hypothetical protein
LVYPALDTWIRKKDDGAIHDGLTTEQFIEVLKFLRVVFLQDAAIMIDRRPKDRIWKHRIFQMVFFIRFKEEVMAAITDLPRPQELVLHDVMPHLIDLQKAQHQTVMSALAVQSQQLSKMSQDSSSIGNAIKDIFTGRTPVRLNSDHPGFRVSTNVTNEGASTSTCQFQFMDSGQPYEGTDNFNTGESVITSMEVSDSQHPQVSTISNDSSIMSHYKMSRFLTTVQDVWREWSVGLGPNPAVSAMEKTWGTRWRSNPTESRFFNRRKVIVDEIGRLVSTEEVNNFDEAIRKLENRRRANDESLNWLQKAILVEKKARQSAREP